MSTLKLHVLYGSVQLTEVQYWDYRNSYFQSTYLSLRFHENKVFSDVPEYIFRNSLWLKRSTNNTAHQTDYEKKTGNLD